MRAVLQRVQEAAVEVEGRVVGRIGVGLLVLLGVAKGDGGADVDYITRKLVTLRVFADEHGKMNRALSEVHGSLLVVSQFTLLGDLAKGRRPAFDDAAPPDLARRLYEEVIARLRHERVPVETGEFGAHMVVSLRNDGPVTFILDSRAPAPG